MDIWIDAASGTWGALEDIRILRDVKEFEIDWLNSVSDSDIMDFGLAVGERIN